MITSSRFARRTGVLVLSSGVALLAIVSICSFSGCDSGQKPLTTAKPTVKVPKPIPVAYVPVDASVAVAIDPQQFFKTPKLSISQLGQFKSLLNADTGVNMDDVEQVLIVGGLGQGLAPSYGSILRYKASVPRQQILQTISPVWEEVSEGDKKYQKPKDNPGLCIYFADDKTVILADEPTLKKMLTVPADAESPLLTRLKKSDDASALLFVLEVVPLRPVVGFALSLAQLPAPFDKPPLSDLKNLLKYVDEAVVKFEIEPELTILATLNAVDEEAAKATDTLIADSLTHIGKLLAAPSSEEEETNQVENPLADIMRQQFQGIVDGLTRTQKDNVVSLEFKGKVLANDLNLIAPMAVSPYIKSWSAAKTEASRTNIARVGAALDSYLAAQGSYPAPASLDANGKPLLSWRVHLLPMLGEQALYEEFKLDEPWDSAHNKPLVARIPAVYRHPREPATGKTQLLLPTGPATLFTGTAGPKPEIITDDKAKTIVLFETDMGKAVEWTKPADLVLDPADPIKGLKGFYAAPLNVLFADGSIGKFDFVKQKLDLPSLLSPAAGDKDAAPEPTEKPDPSLMPAA